MSDLHQAVRQNNTSLLRNLLEMAGPADVDAFDHRGMTPLMVAAEAGDDAAIGLLLEAGAQVDRMQSHALAALPFAANLEVAERLAGAGLRLDDMTFADQTALSFVTNSSAARRLLEAGADPQYLPSGMQRVLVGLSQEPDGRLLTVSPETFLRERHRHFGTANPTLETSAFWHDMVRAGISGFQAAERFPSVDDGDSHPVWCAQRFGQSFTWLPDGRVIRIAGEHEDYYDPDFCIYNDIFVHEPDGMFRIYGYPVENFPPTDFHTATLAGSRIIIIGSLGYQGTREFGSTPVYGLDTTTLRIDRLQTTGDAPGWIYKHRAALLPDGEIRVTGGKVVTEVDGREQHADNLKTYELDVVRLAWRKID